MNSWRRCVPVNELSSSNGFSPGSKPSIKEPLIKQKAVCLAQPRSLLQQSIWKGHNTLLSSLTLIPVLCLPASGKGVLYICILVPVLSLVWKKTRGCGLLFSWNFLFKFLFKAHTGPSLSGWRAQRESMLICSGGTSCFQERLPSVMGGGLCREA